MSKLIKELGTLVHNNLGEVMKQITNQVKVELQKTKDVAKRVEQDYNDFKDMIDFKIKAQQNAYKRLKESIATMNKASKDFESAAKKWQAEEMAKAIAKAAMSIFSNIAGMFTGNPPNFDSAQEAIESIADILEQIDKLIHLIADLAEMFETIQSTFEVNTSYGKSDLDSLQFEVTKDFAKSLEQASYYKDKTQDFDNLTVMANSNIDNMAKKVDVPEAIELKGAMTMAGLAGKDLVNEVREVYRVFQLLSPKSKWLEL